MVHGTWHGTVRENVAGILRAAYLGSAWRSTSETLLLPNDAPDPDCWVRRRNAQPMSQHGRVARYDIADALLVVEIGDSSQSEDLGVMASMYGSAGVASYWVVTHDGVYVHRNPSTSGYLQRELVPTGGRLTLPESALTVAVDELLDVD